MASSTKPNWQIVSEKHYGRKMDLQESMNSYLNSLRVGRKYGTIYWQNMFNNVAEVAEYIRKHNFSKEHKFANENHDNWYAWCGLVAKLPEEIKHQLRKEWGMVDEDFEKEFFHFEWSWCEDYSNKLYHTFDEKCMLSDVNGEKSTLHWFIASV